MTGPYWQPTGTVCEQADKHQLPTGAQDTILPHNTVINK